MNRNEKIRIEILKVCYESVHSDGKLENEGKNVSRINNYVSGVPWITIWMSKHLSSISYQELFENFDYLCKKELLSENFDRNNPKFDDRYMITAKGKDYYEKETDYFQKIMNFLNQNIIYSVIVAVITAFVTTYITNLFL